MPKAETNCGALVFNSIVDSHDFLLHVDMLGGELTKPAQCLDSFFTAAAGEEPTRRFFDDKSTCEEQPGRYKLDAKWDKPLLVGGSKVLVDAVVDPESGEAANLPADHKMLVAGLRKSGERRK